MAKVETGHSAPDIAVPASNGKEVSVADYRGKKVVLYFYPKDNTPGCTNEALDFKAHLQDFAEADTVVLGVSPDPLKSHEKFISKHGLPFVLLSDEDHKLAEAYGVWVEKNMYGKKHMGIERSTFVMDREGVIRKAYRKVKVKGHVEEVLEFVKTLE